MAQAAGKWVKKALVVHHAGGRPVGTSETMKAVKRIGAVVYANLDLGREILRGVRQFCNAHPGTLLDLMSESGLHPQVGLETDPPDCIVTQVSTVEAVEQLRRNCPNVVVTSNRNPVPGVARVLNDDEAVGRMGAAYLASQGFRTLVFLNVQDFAFASERLRGFEQGLPENGELHVFEARTQSAIDGILEELLAFPGPVGVMAASDLHARWLIEAMEDPQQLVPDKISLLGVDDDSLQQALSPIEISSIRLAGERLGYEAAALGLRLADGAAVPEEPIRIAPRHVVSRHSTDAFAIKDRLVARTLRTIRERMGELEDAAELIKLIGVPRRTLEVKFRKHTGQTLAAELARARVHRASELLSTTDLSIKEIAYLVGFSEPRMLTLVFKRVTGELPSDYRERVKPGG